MLSKNVRKQNHNMSKKQPWKTYWSYSQVSVQCSVLHEFGHDHRMFNCTEEEQTISPNGPTTDRQKKTKWRKSLTFGHHSLQTDDVLVGKLPHDGGFAQKILPLLLRVAGLQRLYCHRHLFLPRCFQGASVNFTELACRWNILFFFLS